MEITDNTILIVPNNIKKQILLDLNANSKLLNLKLMSLSEFCKNITFCYDNKTIYYVMNKYKVKYEIALVYLNNLKYVNLKSNYDSIKLNFLKALKNDLINNNLLITDNLFLKFIENKKIVVYGYDYINKFQKNILDSYNAEIRKKETSKYEPTIYKFNTMDEEIEFVANRICDLIIKGIDINNIKLANVSSDYYNSLSRIFNFYHIPINIKKNEPLISSEIGKYFFLNISSDITKTLLLIKEKFALNNEFSLDIYNKIVSICNSYNWCQNFLEIKDMLKYELEHTNMKENFLTNAIEIIDFKDNIIDDDKYVFMMSFNQNVIPKNYKDEDYITDNMKENLLLETTKEKNKIEKDIVLKVIHSIKNLTITYKLKTPFETFYPSSLLDSFTVKEDNFNSDISYSVLSSKINLTKKLDNLLKYGIHSEDLDKLYHNYPISYLTYDNRFTGIDVNQFYEFLNNKLNLSYSSMDNFYRCQFRYYLSNILKVDDFIQSFQASIGTIFHSVLEKSLKENVNPEDVFDAIIKEKEYTCKEKFFLIKLKAEIKFIVETIKEQYKHCSLDKTLYEENIYVNKSGNIKIGFIGFIDKLMYKEENDRTIVAIIDYKTGNPDINLGHAYYGIEMQLPVYLYLSRHSKLKNVEIAGFYLQKILHQEVSISEKDYEKQKKDNLKLVGYSNSNQEILNKFDNSYTNSEVISGMRTKSDGNFYSYTKVLSSDKMDKLMDIVDEKIDFAFADILKCHFPINPKKIGYTSSSIGCDFCKFKDICYRSDKDFVHLKEMKLEDFLGGENNA